MALNKYVTVLSDPDWMLFLDDVRDPKTTYMFVTGNVRVARTYGEFVSLIEKYGLPTIVAFDHDLGDNKSLLDSYPKKEWFSKELNRAYTGADAARYLVQYCLDNKKKLPLTMVHSANPDGAANIHSIIRSGRKVTNT